VLSFFVLAALSACAEGPPAWVTGAATATAEASGLSGTHVWTFYDDGWQRRMSEQKRRCDLLQSLDGVMIGALEGCDRCLVMMAVQLDDPALEGVVAFGVGAPPDDAGELDPHPGQSLGWYVSYDGETAVPQGLVYPEALDLGEAPEGVPSWTPGETYRFISTWAWSL
jgi:hypothetical protein